MLTLLIFGSSFVRDLSFFDRGNKIHFLAGRYVKFVYRYFPGKSFEHFLEPKNYSLIDNVIQCNPDFVCVIFGGNSIKKDLECDNILVSCRDFYTLLNRRYLSLNPRGIIIASQVLLRFIRDPDNKHQCPDPDTFRSYRNQLNRKINSLPTKHNMLIVAGPNNLDNEKYFKRKDGTHLTWEGKSLQFRILLRTLSNLITDGL